MSTATAARVSIRAAVVSLLSLISLLLIIVGINMPTVSG
jgi:hypothetical protein